MPELTKERLAEIEARWSRADSWLYVPLQGANDIPDLIAAVRELQAENERLRAELDARVADRIAEIEAARDGGEG